MRDSLYLAWQYLRHHMGISIVLVGSITLIFFLPSALVVVVDDATHHFRSRAESTPLLVGSRGSQLELVLGTLYFDEPQPEIMRMSQVIRIKALGLGDAIPLHAGIHTAQTTIVGTTAAYFRLRKLNLAAGRRLQIAGECLVGSKAAQRLKLQPGSKLPVSQQQAFTLGDAPLRLHVVGVLRPTETPDDDVIFVDLKTVWIIHGLGHGHIAGAQHGTAAAAEYTDITQQNAGAFHFHGDQTQFPITAVIVIPAHAKARALLLGEYLAPEDTAQIVRPAEVMDALLEKILTIRSYIIAIVLLVSLVTFAVIVLVIMLSIRLRRREIATMVKMGCSRFAITSILGSQIVIILCCSALAAAGLTLLAASFGHEMVRMLVF